MNTSPSRRRFLQQLGLFAGAMAASPFAASMAFGNNGHVTPASLGQGDLYVPKNPTEGPMSTWPSRPTGSKYMGGFCAKPIENVRIAFIGMGKRNRTHLPLVLNIPNCEVVAICDVYEDLAKNGCERVTKETGKACAAYYGSTEAYIDMMKEVKPDAVIVAPSWEWHAKCTCDAMKYGAHTLVEVPMAVSIKELWDMVDHSEKYGVHCMQLENCNYGQEEMMYLNIVRQGLIGELLHGEAAYIHELRSEMHEEKRGTGSWRTYHYAQRNGNLYTTHGLGPVAQYMNLCRGEDTFARISSFGSPALGRAKYAKENWPADHKWNKLKYECGDINTSIIKTHLGRTIMLQWDETSPRPYSRLNLIQGTTGTLAGYPNRIAGENFGPKTMEIGNNGQKVANYHRWIEGAEYKELAEQYKHPLWDRIGKKALEMGGHGGMDYVMLYRAIECLHKGEAMDQNIYEGVTWCAASELSEKSVAQGGMPQLFPDFTRGEWKNTAPLGIIK
ncbi:MAG: Gfo/Idh/MocA family oxidoreductase [Akkermansia sp.]